MFSFFLFPFNYLLCRNLHWSRCSAPTMAPPKLHVLFCLFCCLSWVHPFHWQDPPPFDFRSPGKRRQTPSDFKMLHVLLCEKVLLRSARPGAGEMAQVSNCCAILRTRDWTLQHWCKKFPVFWGVGRDGRYLQLTAKPSEMTGWASGSVRDPTSKKQRWRLMVKDAVHRPLASAIMYTHMHVHLNMCVGMYTLSRVYHTCTWICTHAWKYIQGNIHSAGGRGLSPLYDPNRTSMFFLVSLLWSWKTPKTPPPPLALFLFTASQVQENTCLAHLQGILHACLCLDRQA